MDPKIIDDLLNTKPKDLETIKVAAPTIPTYIPEVAVTPLPKIIPERKPNMTGVQSLLNVVKFLTVLGKAIKDSLNDGKFVFADAVYFIKVAIGIPKLIGSLPNVVPELTDEVTAEERKEIVETIKSEGVFTGDTQVMVSDAIDLALQLKNFVFKHFIKK